MQASSMREMSSSQLQDKLSEYNKELFNLRFQHATGQLGNTQRIPQVKRNIARIKTILREKEMEQAHE
jgi:large subunit ribosomal protein L29